MKWQYHAYKLEEGDDPVAIMNRFGAEGWEAWAIIYGRIFFKKAEAIVLNYPDPKP